VITIFGTTYFTIGAGFVVLALAAPFLFWFARWLWRPNVEDKPRRVRWLAVRRHDVRIVAAACRRAVLGRVT